MQADPPLRPKQPTLIGPLGGFTWGTCCLSLWQKCLCRVVHLSGHLVQTLLMNRHFRQQSSRGLVKPYHQCYAMSRNIRWLDTNPGQALEPALALAHRTPRSPPKTSGTSDQSAELTPLGYWTLPGIKGGKSMEAVFVWPRRGGPSCSCSRCFWSLDWSGPQRTNHTGPEPANMPFLSTSLNQHSARSGQFDVFCSTLAAVCIGWE